MPCQFELWSTAYDGVTPIYVPSLTNITGVLSTSGSFLFSFYWVCYYNIPHLFYLFVSKEKYVELEVPIFFFSLVSYILIM